MFRVIFRQFPIAENERKRYKNKKFVDYIPLTFSLINLRKGPFNKKKTSKTEINKKGQTTYTIIIILYLTFLGRHFEISPFCGLV